MADNQQSRFEKSLGLLTTRFVTLLQKAKDGVLDLKVVSIRLYGSIEKVNLNTEVKFSRAYTPYLGCGNFERSARQKDSFVAASSTFTIFYGYSS